MTIPRTSNRLTLVRAESICGGNSGITQFPPPGGNGKQKTRRGAEALAEFTGGSYPGWIDVSRAGTGADRYGCRWGTLIGKVVAQILDEQPPDVRGGNQNRKTIFATIPLKSKSRCV
ncbi:MAG TPA: hypothetical protein VHR72_11600 [Gemmataceae bacterium]|nr:hypothetical protein [Gemmataceae bacterium]